MRKIKKDKYANVKCQKESETMGKVRKLKEAHVSAGCKRNRDKTLSVPPGEVNALSNGSCSHIQYRNAKGVLLELDVRGKEEHKTWDSAKHKEAVAFRFDMMLNRFGGCFFRKEDRAVLKRMANYIVDGAVMMDVVCPYDGTLYIKYWNKWIERVHMYAFSLAIKVKHHQS